MKYIGAKKDCVCHLLKQKIMPIYIETTQMDNTNVVK